MALHFLALQVQLVVLVSAFVTVSTLWSVSCSLFFYSRCPPCPAICKSEGYMPPCPTESAPLCTMFIWAYRINNNNIINKQSTFFIGCHWTFELPQHLGLPVPNSRFHIVTAYIPQRV